MTDLEKLFKIVVKSDWDEIPFNFSQEDLERMRKAEWYQEKFLEEGRKDRFNQGLLTIIGNAMSPLYSFEKAFLVYKLHFGNIAEQEGAVEALGCLEDLDDCIKEFYGYINDVIINNSWIEKELEEIKEKQKEKKR